LSCAPGFAHCDGDLTRGCEAALDSDAKNCGACHNACQDAPNGTAACRSGRRDLRRADGYANCSGSLADGREARLDSDSQHCGACGNDCLGGTCRAGACALATLASGYDSYLRIAVDAKNVYWTSFNDNIVAKCAIGGCNQQPTTLGIDSHPMG